MTKLCRINLAQYLEIIHNLRFILNLKLNLSNLLACLKLDNILTYIFFNLNKFNFGNLADLTIWLNQILGFSKSETVKNNLLSL